MTVTEVNGFPLLRVDFALKLKPRSLVRWFIHLRFIDVDGCFQLRVWLDLKDPLRKTDFNWISLFCTLKSYNNWINSIFWHKMAGWKISVEIVIAQWHILGLIYQVFWLKGLPILFTWLVNLRLIVVFFASFFFLALRKKYWKIYNSKCPKSNTLKPNFIKKILSRILLPLHMILTRLLPDHSHPNIICS